MTRHYGTSAAVGVAIGALLVGISSPVNAPFTAVAAAIGNVLQVLMTLAALRVYEAERPFSVVRAATFLLMRVVLATAVTSVLILTVSATIDHQRTWDQVFEATVGWVAGDIGTAVIVWALARSPRAKPLI